jgi:hypothetical protein
MKRKSFFESLGGAFSWAHGLKKDTDAIINIDANRSNLLRQVRMSCRQHGFKIDSVRQPAVLPALEVAVRLGDKERSALLEFGGDTWQEIIFAIENKLTACDEATVFIQLEARDARAYVCCTQAHDESRTRQRLVTIVDVTDSHNLVEAYQAALQQRR